MIRRETYNSGTTLSVFAIICFLAAGMPAWAQDVDQEADQEESTELQKVAVTGSRIKRTEIEGPSPVVIITSEDIEREGFNTVYEALRTLTQNSNFGQTEGDGGTFTQNANALDLRGLGPGRTLLLLDGRRITDYPLPFNGQSNLQNLEALPVAAIERIEILASGASAIYGSDAVAGVVNFVTRKDLDTHTITARYGDTSQGGGESQRVQAVGGFNGDRWNFTYAVEYLHRDPIWAFERDFMDSILDDPTTTPDASRNPLLLAPFDPDGDGFTYIDPGEERCAQLPYQQYYERAVGFYCGQYDINSQFTFRSERDNISVFTNATFELTDTTQLYGSLNYWSGESEFTVGDPFWIQTDAGGNIFNANEPGLFGPRLEVWQRRYDLREIGLNANAQKFDEEVLDISVGARGTFGDSFYDWDINYSHQEYDVERDRPLQIEATVNQYWLGEQVGSLFDVPVYDIPDQWKMYQPMTPEVWDTLTDIDHTVADSSHDLVQFVVTGDLMELPAGPLGFAGVLEFGSQDYTITLDPRFGSIDPVTGEELTPNLWWGFTATGGGGSRDRYAAGLEFKLPVTETLTATLATRYDKYDDITEVDDAVTYNAGLEWRPSNTFLLRGSYATTFRAPDMHYVFADPSGFFVTITDQYLCRRDEPGVPFAQCTIPAANPFGAREGNRFLKEEEGDSYTFGFVWEVIDGLTVSLDYFDIDLDDQVADLSLTNVLEREADCRLGMTEGGQPVDINSLECQDALARVQRNPVIGAPNDEYINRVSTGPVNRATQHTNGIDAHLEYFFATDRFGTFEFDVGYTHTLTDEGAEFEGDPIENFRDDLQNFNWRSKARGSATWSISDFQTTLFFDYRGSLPNWAETGRIDGFTVYNWSGTWSFTENQALGVYVQNLFDEDPYVDNTFFTYPYFLFFNYDPTGREIFLQYSVRFDN